MKKYYLLAAVCLMSAAGFSQSQPAVKNENAKHQVTSKISPVADTTQADKRAIADDTKKKKAKKDRSHKECSRMKS